ncbi:dienelactone hydrolase family protein [Undibacterium sp. CY7W]|uniref:Dienelactone hydrolase family protein n=1 Tax=Undibacterium rugosum TaxID=2762291 RepID=A0A923I6B0_9BURK|nr:dienelactone hydrolase family protein [Undibacterium rugosum]MBC3936386.1 dienelactone hydrolase family protein [Undibacterium rugosum]
MLQPVLAQSSSAAQSLSFRFADGAYANYFYLDKENHAQSGLVQAADSSHENWIFVVGGSGCASMGRYLPGYFRGLEGESGVSRIWLLQKRHVAAQDDGSNCSAAFVQDDHFSRWQADQLEFIRFQLAQVPTDKTIRVVMMGISEGAELAPVLALALPVTTHLVLLAHSGDGAMGTYQTLARAYGHMHSGWKQLQAALRLAPADPDRSLIHGRSWRYWSEIRAVEHQSNLRAWKGPVLWAYGDADALIPKDAKSKLQQMVKPASGQWRICVFPGADHGLLSPDHTYLPDFMWQLDRWLASYSALDPCLE